MQQRGGEDQLFLSSYHPYTLYPGLTEICPGRSLQPVWHGIKSVVRQWILTACALCFLEEQRAHNEDPFTTCGDIRRRI